MKDDCPLCLIPDTKPAQLVERGKYVYAAIPYAPIEPGHVMILPYRHVLLERLNIEELVELRDMTCQLKDKLVGMYPDTQPMEVSMLNTVHASIPNHFHSHLIDAINSMPKDKALTAVQELEDLVSIQISWKDVPKNIGFPILRGGPEPTPIDDVRPYLLNMVSLTEKIRNALQ